MALTACDSGKKLLKRAFLLLGMAMFIAVSIRSEKVYAADVATGLGGQSYYLFCGTGGYGVSSKDENNDGGFDGYTDTSVYDKYIAGDIGYEHLGDLTKWEFTETDEAGTYYIKDVESGKYMDFENKSSTLSDTPVEIIVYQNGSTYVLNKKGTGITLNQYGGAASTKICGWSDGMANISNAGNQIRLVNTDQTVTPAVPSDAVLADNLEGQMFFMVSYLSSYGVENTDMNSDQYLDADTDAVTHKKYVLRQCGFEAMSGLATWTFEKAGSEPGVYYVKNTETGKYLNFSGNGPLSDIKIPTTVCRQEDTYLLAQGNYVLNQLGGATKENFGGWKNGINSYSNEGNWFYLLRTDRTAADTASDRQPVASVSENIKLTLYDYSSQINTPVSDMGYLPFYQIPGWEPSVDGLHYWYTSESRYYQPGVPKMESVLKDNYPAIKEANGDQTSGSLEYLFPESSGNGTTVYPISNGDKTGTGLFQKIDGYYVYDSAVNAAYYNADTKKMELYDYVVRPAHTGYSTNEETTGNFLPFNLGHEQGYEDYRTSDRTIVTEVNKPSEAVPDAYRLNETEESGYTDLWFGMHMELDFSMPEDGKINGEELVFDFHGDDDVWVYIDDVLVLDIGGTHAAQSATINFTTGKVTNPGGTGNFSNRMRSGTLKEIFQNALGDDFKESEFNGDTFVDWSMHTLKFYYMERGGNISYCRLRFNIEPLPKGTLNVVKKLDDSSQATPVTENEAYEFKLVKVTGNESSGTTAETPVGGITYTDYAGVVQGTTDSKGKFTLKAGENAMFAGLVDVGDVYKVYEVVDSGEDAIYTLSKVEYIGNTAGEEKLSSAYIKVTGLETDARNSIIHNAVFTNKLKTSDFSVKKIVGGNMGDGNKEFSFTAALYLKDGGTQIDFPAGTGYTIEEDGTATFSLTHDKTCVFSNIPLGAYVVVTENDYSAESEGNYSTTCKVDGTSVAAAQGEENVRTASLITTLASGDSQIEFTNKRDVAIDTGVYMDSSPYVLIAGIVLTASVVLFWQRRRSRYEG